MANELLDYFNDLESARLFAEILCLTHHHHHEKKIKRNASHTNLPKVMSSPNFIDQQTTKGTKDFYQSVSASFTRHF